MCNLKFFLKLLKRLSALTPHFLNSCTANAQAVDEQQTDEPIIPHRAPR